MDSARIGSKTARAASDQLAENAGASSAAERVLVDQWTNLPGPGAKARKLLAEGNRRYTENRAIGPNRDAKRRAAQAPRQTPFAAILSCIDSRVPPEIIFDRGIGDLFVIRTAGQVLDSAAIGSLEFSVVVFKVPLVVVLGHERCGAVTAAMEMVDNPERVPPGDIAFLARQIENAIPPIGTKKRLDLAVHRNVGLVIEKLKSRPLIAQAIEAGAVEIVGARCELKTGKVSLI